MIDYRIVAKENVAPRMGELISMLEYTRSVTLNDVVKLSVDELDYLPDEHSNSIGSLLLHMARVERYHQIVSFEQRDLTDEEMTLCEPGLSLGEEARKQIKQLPIDYYVNEFAQTRQVTLQHLKEKANNWLLKEEVWDNGVTHNNYYLWFHVLEDEISHRGQIRLMKRLMKQSSNT